MRYWEKILLYGYSRFDLVKTKYYELIQAGFNVEGYIDQNADSLALEGEIPCWKLNDLPFSTEERRRMLIIVLLQNARKHEQIALQLKKSGFNYILYLPDIYERPKQEYICEIYNEFLMGDFDSLTDIPSFDEVREDYPVIEKKIMMERKSLIVYLPLTILYEYQQDEQSDLKNIRNSDLYRQLYDFIFDRRSECNDYLEFMGAKTEEQKRQLLVDRRQLVQRFECEFNKRSEYFNRTAAIARWNDVGYFNVVDGHHRVTYLAYKGCSVVPVRISNTDYNCWKNGDR